MNWPPVGESKRCISSEEGYLVRKYSMQEGFAYVARTPAPASKILSSSTDLAQAKAACFTHLESTRGKAA